MSKTRWRSSDSTQRRWRDRFYPNKNTRQLRKKRCLQKCHRFYKVRPQDVPMKSFLLHCQWSSNRRWNSHRRRFCESFPQINDPISRFSWDSYIRDRESWWASIVIEIHERCGMTPRNYEKKEWRNARDEIFEEYGARAIRTKLFFDSEEDKLAFLLRWS